MNAILKPVQSLDDLAAEWLEAKAAENAANKRRIEIEDAIVAITGKRQEGSETTPLENGWKVTVTGKITRKLDEEAWAQVKDSVPEDLRPVREVVKLELDTKGVRWLEENQPEVYRVVAQAITITPAKTAVEIKVA